MFYINFQHLPSIQQLNLLSWIALFMPSKGKYCLDKWSELDWKLLESQAWRALTGQWFMPCWQPCRGQLCDHANQHLTSDLHQDTGLLDN